MKSQVTMFLVAMGVAMMSGRASADYILGEFPACLTASTHVVDATVTEITKERYARLKILNHIKGTNAPKLLTGTALSCTRQPPGAFGMKARTRYIIMLRGASLFEETSYFEVIKREDGTLGCRLSDFHKNWLGTSDTWVTLDAMRVLMSSPENK